MHTTYDRATREIVTHDYAPLDPAKPEGEWDMQITERRPATEREIAAAEVERATRRQDLVAAKLDYCRPGQQLRALANFARTAARLADQAPGQPGLMAELRLALAKHVREADSALERRHDLIIEDGDATRAYREWTERVRALDAAERGEEPAAVEVAAL